LTNDCGANCKKKTYAHTARSTSSSRSSLLRSAVFSKEEVDNTLCSQPRRQAAADRGRRRVVSQVHRKHPPPSCRCGEKASKHACRSLLANDRYSQLFPIFVVDTDSLRLGLKFAIARRSVSVRSTESRAPQGRRNVGRPKRLAQTVPLSDGLTKRCVCGDVRLHTPGREGCTSLPFARSQGRLRRLRKKADDRLRPGHRSLLGIMRLVVDPANTLGPTK